MGGEWRQHEWGDIATLEYGKALRDYRTETGQYRVYGTNGPIGWHNEPLCMHPSVIVGRKGAYRGILYSPEPFFVIDTAFYLEPKREMDLRWAYYCLLTYDINGMDSGSAIPSTSRESFYRLPVYVPPLKDQQAIAHILGTLDDKIELNRRMNETLEAMARALFKSWFVDFDPVRAKAEGRDHGLPKPLADLFPDSFEDSALGEIPKGWRVRLLSEVTAVITKGTTPRQDDIATAHNADELINYIRVNAIDEDGSILLDKLTSIPKSVHNGVLKRSILCSNDVLYTIAGTIGRIATVEDYLLPANINQAVAIIRPKPTTPAGFLILIMKQPAFRKELHSNIVHAVQANLSLGILSKSQVVFPSEDLLPHLFMPIEAILRKIRVNHCASRLLSSLRDALLPKLITGELRVSNAERIVGRCI